MTVGHARATKGRGVVWGTMLGVGPTQAASTIAVCTACMPATTLTWTLNWHATEVCPGHANTPACIRSVCVCVSLPCTVHSL
jgi:hypothetical protein